MNWYFIAFEIGFIITLFGMIREFYRFFIVFKNNQKDYNFYHSSVIIVALGWAIMTFSTILSAMYA